MRTVFPDLLPGEAGPLPAHPGLLTEQPGVLPPDVGLLTAHPADVVSLTETLDEE